MYYTNGADTGNTLPDTAASNRGCRPEPLLAYHNTEWQPGWRRLLRLMDAGKRTGKRPESIPGPYRF